MMRRWLLWIVIVFSFIGIVGSSIATYQYFQIQQAGFEQKSFCAINEYINCDIAYASSHAKLGGIPVSWLGLIFYLWTGILAGFLLFKKQQEQTIASFGWLLALGGLGMTIYKAYIAFFVLKVLCLICLSMHLVNIVMFLAWHGFLKLGIRNWTNLTLKPKFVSLAIYTGLAFGIGWVAIANYQGTILKESKLDVPMDEIVLFHFRQSQYQFEVDPQAPVWGNPNAKVTVVEFSDFQCPFCKEAAFHLKATLAEFRDKIRFYFYHYPLDQSCNYHISGPIHDKACIAAQASVCATKMGDFWGYHDDIFRNQKKLGRELFIEQAKKRGWNETTFTECLEAPETIGKVKENIEAGNKIYVTGTPTVLVNHRRVKYWTNPEALQAIVREEIKRSSN